MGTFLHERAREIAQWAEPDNEDYPELFSCSFCDSEVDPNGENVAISWAQYMELVREGLSTLFVTGTEQGNPPSDGGDGLEWLSVEDVLSYCGDAIRDGPQAYDLEEAIRNELAEDVWTYRNFGWDQVEFKFGWERFKADSQGSDHLNSEVVLSPEKLLGRLETIITVLLNNDECDVLPIVPAGTKMWRVRPHEHPNPNFVPSGKELGSAPEVAARDNRFSPAGVSMFYGSDELETALSEIGYSECPYATAGQFQTTKDLVLLDLTDVDWFPSIFDPAEARYYYEADFIRGFGEEIRRPLGEDDEDDDEAKAKHYRPTQRVVAEGILRFSEPIDGIRFKSAKDPERYNYVLFFGNEACGDLGGGDEAVLALDLSTVETVPTGGVSSSEPDKT
ncbi:RES domain-containing protein (plasmid) [Rhodococcus aetherivorans]|uniref:RES domain-containing protein n=1 Tax=Rhodococcus aetherivorans TaxID=191292 RepID=UPI0026EB1D06|nr:RES domain-containing protein [Rhodococcus aetherivorans]WKX02059.1 RES domain-containing protein [Rhodococcus aetherivorans]